MDTILLKEKMHQAIELIDDTEFLKAISLLLSQKSQEFSLEIDDNLQIELDSLKQLHQAGKSKSYSFAEVKKLAKNSLKNEF